MADIVDEVVKEYVASRPDVRSTMAEERTSGRTRTPTRDKPVINQRFVSFADILQSLSNATGLSTVGRALTSESPRAQRERAQQSQDMTSFFASPEGQRLLNSSFAFPNQAQPAQLAEDRLSSANPMSSSNQLRNILATTPTASTTPTRPSDEKVEEDELVQARTRYRELSAKPTRSATENAEMLELYDPLTQTGRISQLQARSEARYSNVLALDLQTKVLAARAAVDVALKSLDQEFASQAQSRDTEQRRLDRSIEEGRLEESIRSARALEASRGQEIELVRRRDAMDNARFLMSNPVALFIANKTGLLKSMLAGSGVDVSSFDIPMTASMPFNMSDFQRMTPDQKQFVLFFGSASSGKSPDTLLQELSAGAPRPVALPTRQ